MYVNVLFLNERLKVWIYGFIPELKDNFVIEKRNMDKRQNSRVKFIRVKIQKILIKIENIIK